MTREPAGAAVIFMIRKRVLTMEHLDYQHWGSGVLLSFIMKDRPTVRVHIQLRQGHDMAGAI